MSNIFNEYPYRNYNDFNLDYILRKLLEMDSRLTDYVKRSTITFHDPITWDITTQYTINTMVVDSDGTAYLSVNTVPSGINITNTDYWQPIFNYDDNINKLRGTIAYNEQNSATATATHVKGSYLYYNGLLYQAIRDISSGDAFTVGSNIQLVTLSDSINIAISNETVARNKSDEELNKKIDNYSGENKTSTVTGNDTRTAGNINDSADNVVIHGKKSILMDSDGSYTEEIVGNKNVTVNGNKNVTVNGSSTEVYSSDKTDSVQGTHTITRNNVTATITGEVNITGKKFSIQSTEKTLPIVFPDKTIDLHNISNKVGYNPVYFLFGDSLYNGYTPDSTVRHGWFYWMERLLTAGGATVIGTENITDTNVGSAFSGSKTYIDHLNRTVAEHPEYLDLPVSTVIVYSGTNDINHEYADTYNGILAFCDAIHTYWPTALVKIGFLCSRPDVANVSSTYVAFKNACKEAGAVYIRGTEYALGFKREYSSDGTHLTLDGYRLLTNRLFGGTHSDTLSFFQAVDVDFTIPSASTMSITNLQLRFSATADGVNVSMTNAGGYGTLTTNNIPSGRYDIAYESPILYPAQINSAYSEPISLNSVVCYLSNLVPGGASPRLLLYVSSQANGSCTVAGNVMRLEFYRLISD